MGRYNKVIRLGNRPEVPIFVITPPGWRFVSVSFSVDHRLRLSEEIKEEGCFIEIVGIGKVGERSEGLLHRGLRFWWTDGWPNGFGKALTANKETNTRSTRMASKFLTGSVQVLRDRRKVYRAD